jgi:6-pyruvoyl-tetrahydropterin synthase
LSFEGAPKKCQSIHGHSWLATLTIEQEMSGEMLTDFGVVKRIFRSFLDDKLDHHLALHKNDPMIDAVRTVKPDSRILELDFQPTTERFAKFVCETMAKSLRNVVGLNARFSVHIQETSVNAAEHTFEDKD